MLIQMEYIGVDPEVNLIMNHHSDYKDYPGAE